jgi:maleate isomerase
MSVAPLAAKAPRFMPDGYGDLGRIGLVFIHSSVVMENEMWAMATPGVSIHTSRLRIGKINVKDIGAMMDSPAFETSVRLLAECPIDVLLFGGTSASFLHGNAWDARVTERMESWAPGITAVTTATACRAALSHLGIGAVSLATPYIDEVHGRCAAWLEANGHPVMAHRNLGILEDRALAEVPLDEIYDLCLSVDHPKAEAIFISCTNFRSIAVIAALEERLGKPVISAVQASMWYALRLMKVAGARPGYGVLMRDVECAI